MNPANFPFLQKVGAIRLNVILSNSSALLPTKCYGCNIMHRTSSLLLFLQHSDPRCVVLLYILHVCGQLFLHCAVYIAISCVTLLPVQQTKSFHPITQLQRECVVNAALRLHITSCQPYPRHTLDNLCLSSLC